MDRERRATAANRGTARRSHEPAWRANAARALRGVSMLFWSQEDAFRRGRFVWVLVVLALFLSPALWAQPAQSADDRLHRLEEEITALKAEVAKLQAGGAPGERLAEIERRIDLLA